MAEADEVVAWEACKENAQPIRQGRRAAALKALAHDDADQRVARRAEWEQALKQAAAGADPLASWVAYVKWTQEAYVTGGKDARLLQLLEDCAYGFKDDVRYTDDQRYLRIWIQYADMVRDPEPIFDYLYDRHIGQNHALFWEAWASVLEVKRKYSAADKAYDRGILLKAQPLDRLQRSHLKFQQRQVKLLQSGGPPAYEAEVAAVQKPQRERKALNRLTKKEGSSSIRPTTQRPAAPLKASNPAAAKPASQPPAETIAGNFQVYIDRHDEGEMVDENGRSIAGPWESGTMTQQVKENTGSATSWDGVTLKQEKAGGARAGDPVAPKECPFAIHVDDGLAQDEQDARAVSEVLASVRLRLDGPDRLQRRHVEELMSNPLSRFAQGGSAAELPTAAPTDPAANKSMCGPAAAPPPPELQDTAAKREEAVGYAPEILRHAGEEVCFEEVRERMRLSAVAERAAAERQWMRASLDYTEDLAEREAMPERAGEYIPEQAEVAELWLSNQSAADAGTVPAAEAADNASDSVMQAALIAENASYEPLPPALKSPIPIDKFGMPSAMFIAADDASTPHGEAIDPSESASFEPPPPTPDGHMPNADGDFSESVAKEPVHPNARKCGGHGLYDDDGLTLRLATSACDDGLTINTKAALDLLMPSFSSGLDEPVVKETKPAKSLFTFSSSNKAPTSLSTPHAATIKSRTDTTQLPSGGRNLLGDTPLPAHGRGQCPPPSTPAALAQRGLAQSSSIQAIQRSLLDSTPLPTRTGAKPSLLDSTPMAAASGIHRSLIDSTPMPAAPRTLLESTPVPLPTRDLLGDTPRPPLGAAPRPLVPSAGTDRAFKMATPLQPVPARNGANAGLFVVFDETDGSSTGSETVEDMTINTKNAIAAFTDDENRSAPPSCSNKPQPFSIFSDMPLSSTQLSLESEPNEITIASHAAAENDESTRAASAKSEPFNIFTDNSWDCEQGAGESAEDMTINTKNAIAAFTDDENRCVPPPPVSNLKPFSIFADVACDGVQEDDQMTINTKMAIASFDDAENNSFDGTKQCAGYDNQANGSLISTVAAPAFNSLASASEVSHEHQAEVISTRSSASMGAATAAFSIFDDAPALATVDCMLPEIPLAKSKAASKADAPFAVFTDSPPPYTPEIGAVKSFEVSSNSSAADRTTGDLAVGLLEKDANDNIESALTMLEDSLCGEIVSSSGNCFGESASASAPSRVQVTPWSISQPRNVAISSRPPPGAPPPPTALGCSIGARPPPDASPTLRLRRMQQSACGFHGVAISSRPPPGAPPPPSCGVVDASMGARAPPNASPTLRLRMQRQALAAAGRGAAPSAGRMDTS